MKNLINVPRWNEYEHTNNRSVYNQYRKRDLENKVEIHCSICQYHGGENYTHKYYGGVAQGSRVHIKYPNWKLSTKNRKQWMYKGKEYVVDKKINTESYYYDEGNPRTEYTIYFKRNPKEHEV